MLKIGVCGRSGSGKSYFCRIAEDNGIKIIDCDKVYKDLVSYKSDCLVEIAEYFGIDVIKDNSLNRRYLAPIVFSDKSKLELLNSITFKHISKEIDKILSGFNNEDIVLIDAPVLFESGIDKQCDYTIGIVASDERCVSRIVNRDKISEEEAYNRLKSQYSEEFLREKCDFIIENNYESEYGFRLIALLWIGTIKGLKD